MKNNRIKKSAPRPRRKARHSSPIQQMGNEEENCESSQLQPDTISEHISSQDFPSLQDPPTHGHDTLSDFLLDSPGYAPETITRTQEQSYCGPEKLNEWNPILYHGVVQKDVPKPDSYSACYLRGQDSLDLEVHYPISLRHPT